MLHRDTEDAVQDWKHTHLDDDHDGYPRPPHQSPPVQVVPNHIVQKPGSTNCANSPLPHLDCVHDGCPRPPHQRLHVQVLPKHVVQARRQELGDPALVRRVGRVGGERRLRLAQVRGPQNARRAVHLRCEQLTSAVCRGAELKQVATAGLRVTVRTVRQTQCACEPNSRFCCSCCCCCISTLSGREAHQRHCIVLANIAASHVPVTCQQHVLQQPLPLDYHTVHVPEILWPTPSCPARPNSVLWHPHRTATPAAHMPTSPKTAP